MIILKRLTCYSFIFIILGPAFEYFVNATESYTLDDTRVDYPLGNVIYNLYSDNTKARHAFESYFNRMFSGRDFYVQLWNTLSVAVFSDHEKVYIGKEGWLFFKNYISNHIAREREIFKNRNLIHSNFANLQQLLDELGIDLILLIPPYKTRVYPENFPDLPESLLHDSPGNAIIYSAASGKNRIHVIDIKTALLERKQDLQLYYRGDHHWTLGAGLVANDLVMDVIAAITLSEPARRGFVLTETMSQAPERAEFKFLQGVKPLYEHLPEVVRPWTTKPKTMGNYRHWSYNSSINPPFPGLVVLGDSFFQHYFDKESLLDLFSKTTFYNNDNNVYIHGRNEHIPDGTRFILLEIFEQNTDKLYTQAWWNDVLSLIGGPGSLTQQDSSRNFGNTYPSPGFVSGCAN